MKSYDDLQRFKEKTQTNHIEFKDMSEQSLNSDTTNWAIIKQLLNDDAGSVLDKSQRIDVAAPQPIDPSAFATPPAPAAPAPAKPAVQSFATTAAASGSSLLDSISSSLKTAGNAAASPAPASAPATAPVTSAQHPGLTPAETAAESAALRPAPVAQITSAAGTSLFEQLAAQTPARTTGAHTSLSKPAKATTPAVADAPAPDAPAAEPAEPSSRSALFPPPPVASAPAAPAPQAGYVAPRHEPARAAAPDISYRQLFSSASARALSKESLLQPLLEKIASCR